MPVQTVRTPYIHTGTYLYLFTLLPACDHERPSERHAFLCLPRTKGASQRRLPLFPKLCSRKEQRVRSHTHLAAALVRHDDRTIPVDIIGFPRSESPDLCEASSALVPYYVHDYSGSAVLPAVRFLYQRQAATRTLFPPKAQVAMPQASAGHATTGVGRTDVSRRLVDGRRDSCRTTVPAISEQLLRSPA